MANSKYFILKHQKPLYSSILFNYLMLCFCKITLQQQCISSIFYVFQRFY